MAYAGADAKLEGAVPTTACGACNAHGPAGGTTRSAALVESAELTLQPPVQAQLEQLHPAPQPATAAAQPLDVSVALVNQLQTDVEKLGAARVVVGATEEELPAHGREDAADGAVHAVVACVLLDSICVLSPVRMHPMFSLLFFKI